MDGVNEALWQQRVDERDEIIVMLQHVIRDLRHEIDNLRAGQVYGAFAEASA